MHRMTGMGRGACTNWRVWEEEETGRGNTREGLILVRDTGGDEKKGKKRKEIRRGKRKEKEDTSCKEGHQSLPPPLCVFHLRSEGHLELFIKRRLPNYDAELALRNGPFLGDDVPDGEVVPTESVADVDRRSRLQVVALEASKDFRGLARGFGEGEVELRHVATIDGARVGDGKFDRESLSVETGMVGSEMWEENG